MNINHQKAITKVTRLGFPWPVDDPFLFCAYHEDIYPTGNERLEPNVSLQGRNLGNDFTKKEGFRMYHGETVPGFPAHPHCGFETLTIVEKGFVDHTDSLGAKARYGEGDFQWLTTGRGILHSEMFPLLNTEKENPLELFQIWLNLPAEKKESPPAFNMYWRESYTHFKIGEKSQLKLYTGQLGHFRAPILPPTASYANSPTADIVVALIMIAKNETFKLPEALSGDALRSLYFYQGDSVVIQGEIFSEPVKISLAPLGADVSIYAPNDDIKLLLLQGVPLKQSVVQHGPFVAVDQETLIKKIDTYRQTQFGGWGVTTYAPVHDSKLGRFAQRNEHIEKP